MRNDGTSPALFVHPKEVTMEYALLCDDAYLTLLPGEEREIRMTLKKRCGLFFEHKDTPPLFKICTLNQK